MMVGRRKINRGILSLLRTRSVKKKRTIVIGLKSDNSSREMLLRLLHFIVIPGDTVLAVHVQEPDDTFDPNTFHIHEDLCKSKHVDFQVKICTGKSYIAELSHQVRVNFAAILAIGCSLAWPKDSTVSNCLKALPPTCSLLVMDKGGRILLLREGTSQQGSTTAAATPTTTETTSRVLQSSMSALLLSTGSKAPDKRRQVRKSLTMPCCSNSSSQQNEQRTLASFKKNLHHIDVMPRRVFQKLAALEIKGYSRRFTVEYLKRATDNFSPEMLIAEGGQSKVYRATLDDGQSAAVKVYKMSENHVENLFLEVEILSGLKHENIIQLLGYCYSREIKAVVYNLLEDSVAAKLPQLEWSGRMKVAVDVAKALDYLHSSSPPIIHRDVKSSNILLSDNCQPLLSDFGAALVYQQIQQAPEFVEQNRVIGTLGYLAPEYMMYGKVDDKIDVYSFGVVLLELITGKEAIHSKPTPNHESLVLWARSLLCSGLCERIIDPNLGEDYDKDEMKIMMIAARLCLLHSSSRRPTMKTILRLFNDPARWLEMQKKRDQLLERISSREVGGSTSDDSESCEILVIDDN